jgi:hypothetical protein
MSQAMLCPVRSLLLRQNCWLGQWNTQTTSPLEGCSFVLETWRKTRPGSTAEKMPGPNHSDSEGVIAPNLDRGKRPIRQQKDSACEIFISRILSCGSNQDDLCKGIPVHQFLHNAACRPSFFAYRE